MTERAKRALFVDDLLHAHPVHVVWEITLACNLKCGHCGSRAGKRRANIGHETQQGGRHAPENRIGHADPEQCDRHDEAEPGVDDRLGEQEATDPLPGFIHRPGRERDPPLAHHPNEAIAEILPLAQHEDR